MNSETEYHPYLNLNFSPCYDSSLYAKDTMSHIYERLRDENCATTALFWAATVGNEGMIRAVLSVGHHSRVIFRSNTGDLNVPIQGNQGGWTIPWSPRKSDEELVQYVLSESTALVLQIGEPSQWTTVLHWAVSEAYPALLKLALDKGAEVDQVNHLGETALHKAARVGCESAARVLLEMNADVVALGRCGMQKTPLTIAREGYKGQGTPALVWLLLENVEDRDYRDEEGVPLLHLAVKYGHTVLVEDLLDRYGSCPAVDINVRDLNGGTALISAARGGSEEMVSLLVRKGADIMLVDNYGMTAYNVNVVLTTKMVAVLGEYLRWKGRGT